MKKPAIMHGRAPITNPIQWPTRTEWNQLPSPNDNSDHDDLEDEHQRDAKGDRLDLQDQVRQEDVADDPGKNGRDKELQESAFREESRGRVNRADPALLGRCFR